MELRDERQVENTRDKLGILEERFEQVQRDPATNPRVRDLTLRSLRRLINQLKEEIARFEARTPV